MGIKYNNSNIKRIVIDNKFIKEVCVWEDGIKKTLFTHTPPLFNRNNIPYTTTPSGLNIEFVGGSVDYFKREVLDITLKYSGSVSSRIDISTGDATVYILPEKIDLIDLNKVPYTISGSTQPDFVNFSANDNDVDEASRTISRLSVSLTNFSNPGTTGGTIYVGNKSADFLWFNVFGEYIASVVLNDVTFTPSEWDQLYGSVYKGESSVSKIKYLPNDFNMFCY